MSRKAIFTKKGDPEVIQAFIILAFLWIGILAGLAVLGWQIFIWLKTGNWVPIPLSSALHLIGGDFKSIYFPQNWNGLAKILRWLLELPLSLCILIGVPIVVKIIDNLSD